MLRLYSRNCEVMWHFISYCVSGFKLSWNLSVYCWFKLIVMIASILVFEIVPLKFYMVEKVSFRLFELERLNWFW